MVILATQAEEANSIETIVDDDPLNGQKKEKRIKIKENNLKKQSSFQTIFNVSNSMMGSALLVMPVNFYISGLISALISSFIVAIISYLTCNLVVIHSRDDEIDYPEAILRILGKPWAVLFNVMSMILLYLVGLIHFVLMAEVFYSVVKNIVTDSSGFAPSDTISFSVFSMQYVGLIMFAICMILFSIKDLRHILRVNDKGVYMILTFCVFIIYLAFDVCFREGVSFVTTGIPGENPKELKLILFTDNLETLIGIFALAYMIHNSIAGIMKNNRDSNKNSRDLGISYGLVFILYSILGIAGMIAVAGLFKAMKLPEVPKTIMELLIKTNPYLSTAQYVLGCIALTLIFTQLTTVIPILCFFTRRQMFDLFYGPKKKIPAWQFHLFNIAYALSCLVVEIFVLDINKIVGFTGAVGGFLLIYIIPIYLHIKCVYYQQKPFIRNSAAHEMLIDTETPDLSTQFEKCRDHSNVMIKNVYVAYGLYGLFIIFGLGILIAQIYDLVRPKKGG